MRGLAALAVAMFHGSFVWMHFPLVISVVQFGYLAVPLFFCLSGFVMLWTWHWGTNNEAFLVRRLAKIYPMVLFTLLISLAAYWLIRNPLAGYAGGKDSIVYNILLIQSWFSNNPNIRQSWNGVTWSLSCEAFFYLCSPLLLPLIERMKARLCLVLVVGIFLLKVALQVIFGPNGANDFFYFSPAVRILEYIQGAMVCRLIIHGHRFPIRSTLVMFLAGVALPLFVFSILDPSRNTGIAGLVVNPGFLVLIAVASGRDIDGKKAATTRFISSRAFVWFGDVSYSLYMMHALVLGAFVFVANWVFRHAHFTITTPMQGEVLSLVYLVLAVIAAATTFYVIEKPAQTMILKLFGKRALAGRGASL
jgi:peptidoglycan/LPS O-acetylase OafA/YrhL